MIYWQYQRKLESWHDWESFTSKIIAWQYFLQRLVINFNFKSLYITQKYFFIGNLDLLGQKSLLKMEENPWVTPIAEQYLVGISHVLDYIKTDTYKMWVLHLSERWRWKLTLKFYLIDYTIDMCKQIKETCCLKLINQKKHRELVLKRKIMKCVF